MMPDLGRYAVEVISAYVVSLGLLSALVCWVMWRAARVRAALAAVEARQGKRNG
jgi:heme exporter protein D